MKQQVISRNLRALGLGSVAATLAVLSFFACGGAALPARLALDVPAVVTERGEPVYVGTVYPLGVAAAEPSFMYERRVAGAGDDIVSTHVTRDAKDGAVALAESASHAADYSLRDYSLYTNQLGQSGSVEVSGSTVSFHIADAGGERSNTEELTDPVAVGPTLVGFIVKHLPELRAGETVRVRLAVLDRLETLGFELHAGESAAGQTQIVMEPSSFFVSLVVDPITFTFETETAKLVRLEGRVPPKVRAGDDWKDFDARVEYRFVASAYR